jgi:hypothetical protein
MKTVYESFSELAEAMTAGDGLLHKRNCPGENDCIAWQRGVKDFAGWLDHIGVKPQITDGAEDFYDYVRKRV